MKKKNRLYTILALFLVMSLALFLTPTAFAADDLDDLGPLIPSDLDPDHPDNLPPLIPSDFDDLPPLIPKTPPGKEPPTRPPIEIEVPDDGEDLDLDLSEDDIGQLKETSVWIFQIINNASWPIFSRNTPGVYFSHYVNFEAKMLSQSTMFGNYTGEGSHKVVVANEGDFLWEDTSPIEGSFELWDWTDPDVLPPLGASPYPKGYTGPGSQPDDDDDDVGPLIPSHIQFNVIGYGEGFVSTSFERVEGPGYDFKIYAYGNGFAIMRTVDGEFLGKFSQKVFWSEVA